MAVEPFRFLLSGGGSGGHIYPALAIADALRAREPDSAVLFVGATGKMEMRRVPAAGYEIVGVPVSGFHRGLDRRNLSFPVRLVGGLGKAFGAVRRFRPNAAVGSGGYASGPALAAAAALRIPVFVQEQNAYPGVTNRLLGRIATTVFGAYPEADRYFPSGKTLHTGNPLRSSLNPSELPPATAARTHFGLAADLPTLLSFGGSQGARSMNEAHAAMRGFWASHPELQLIWQTGEGYYERYRASATAALPNVACVPYLERMDLAYGAADAVACRAGALSISELQLLGKPCVLVPSPNVAGDHQTANARAVEAAGGALVVADADQVERLTAVLPELLADAPRLAAMRDALLAQARPNAAGDIADAILRHVRR